ncbi:uncharacterized protein [Phyllobates terribilis]|uniref:uncharacterized protein n=1 Tax=Phyllobates terribilis TaxID=111132 RepID=UPI003CCB6987
MDTPKPEELLRKIQELESAHANLRHEMSKLALPDARVAASTTHMLHALPPPPPPPRFRIQSPVAQLDERLYLNILQCMGQAIHIMNADDRLIYWNRPAEKLYGYTAAEVLGKTVYEVLVDDENVPLGTLIVNRVKIGESWTGLFPVRSKSGRRFSILVTDSPLYDEDGTLIGVACVASDSKPFETMRYTLPDSWSSETFSHKVSSKLGLDPDQPLQVAISSKITDLASKVSNKVRSKMKFNESTDGEDENEGIAGIRKMTTGWMNKKAMKWPWKGNEQQLPETREPQPPQFGWAWVQNDDKTHDCDSLAPPCSWSSPLNVSTTSSKTSCASSTTSGSSAKKLDMDIDCLDFEVLWEDLIFKEQIGQGSCGTVYHGFWCGSEVAIKVFSKVDYTEDAIFSFRQEVSLMKGLRHPNILLFMGAVTSPEHLCIVSEFLPRGSLFRQLQRNLCKLDWRRRVHMALDIARGMNYLHCCNPPIVHRDLKSSNLLVDKNWTVKVADFGLSRIKHETYLTTRTGKGTPQWMAPEVLRHEPSDEKSDVYSYGVILWELATEKTPWESLNAMQVIGAVGFMNQRLEIPSDVDVRWAAIIKSCWQSDPRSRPSFQELLKTLKDLARQYSSKHQGSRSNPVDISLEEV